MKTRYVIEGMHCDGCVRRVKTLLGKVDGVTVDEVTIGGAVVETADAERGAAILAVLTKAGYEAREAT